MSKFVIAPLIAVLAILALGCVYQEKGFEVKVSPEPIDPKCINRGDGCRFEYQEPDADYLKYGQDTIFSTADVCNSRCVVRDNKCVLDETYQTSCMDCLKKCDTKYSGDLDKVLDCQQKCAR